MSTPSTSVSGRSKVKEIGTKEMLIGEFGDKLGERVCGMPIFKKPFVEKLLREGFITCTRDKLGRRRFNESQIERLSEYFDYEVIYEREDCITIDWNSLIRCAISPHPISKSQMDLIQRRIDKGEITFLEDDMDLEFIKKYKAIRFIDLIKNTEKRVVIAEGTAIDE